MFVFCFCFPTGCFNVFNCLNVCNWFASCLCFVFACLSILFIFIYVWRVGGNGGVGDGGEALNELKMKLCLRMSYAMIYLGLSSSSAWLHRKYCFLCLQLLQIALTLWLFLWWAGALEDKRNIKRISNEFKNKILISWPPFMFCKVGRVALENPFVHMGACQTQVFTFIIKYD